ncbi:MAG: DUF4363 family protein [Oscillospiraceae bacterium]
MKRVKICSVIMIFLMLLCSFGSYYAKKVCNEMSDECKSVLKNFVSENHEDDYRGASSLSDSWNKKSTILSLIVKKERIYETGASVSRLKNAEGMEKSEILSELNFIIYCLENIAEEESVKIKNIF